MMRSLSLVCVLASGMGVAAVAQAAAPATPALSDPAPSAPVAITGATKIAVIQFQGAVTATNEFQRDVRRPPQEV